MLSRGKCNPLPDAPVDLDSMRQLWAAVVLRAIDDLSSGQRSHRDSARWFLTDPDSHYRAVMRAIGLDCADAPAKLRPYLEGRQRLPGYKMHEATRRPTPQRMSLPVDIRTVRRARRIVSRVCARHGLPEEILRTDRRPLMVQIRKEIAERVFLHHPMRPVAGMRAITHGELARMIGMHRNGVDCFVRILKKEAQQCQC